jgi:hypothetical protein
MGRKPNAVQPVGVGLPKKKPTPSLAPLIQYCFARSTGAPFFKIWLGQREKIPAIAGRASRYLRGFADEKHQHSNP